MTLPVRVASAGLFLAFLLAGCGDPTVAPVPASPLGNVAIDAPPSPAAGAGAVEGRVVDDEARPLRDALLELPGLGRSTAAEDDGAFGFFQVPAGSWTLRATHPGHASVETVVAVAADATARVDLVLVPLPGSASYHVTVQFTGYYTCAHEIPIWTGDCMILYETEVGPLLGDAEDPVTTEAFAYRTLVGPGWASVVVELDWTYAANNQLDGMRLYLENGNGTEQGHAYKVARADGPASPLRLVAHRGEPHERADYYAGTETKAFIPDGGEEVLLRVFPRGRLYEATSMICTNPFQGTGCLLGVGAGIDLRFTVYASTFYGARAPDDFSALPPG